MVHSLVSEVSVDFKDCLQAAYDQPLEVEFRSDTQIAFDIQCIMMCHKGSGVGAARDRMHHRCFNFEEGFLFEKPSDQRDDPASLDKGLFYSRVHNHVEIALAVSELLILEAMELFRKWRDGLGDDPHRFAVQCDFASPCHEGVSFRFDDITDFEELFCNSIVEAFGKFISIIIDLDQSFTVFDLGESCLAHNADKFQPPCQGITLALIFFLVSIHLFEIAALLQKLPGGYAFVDLIGVGIDPFFSQLFCLFDAFLNIVVVKYQMYS